MRNRDRLDPGLVQPLDVLFAALVVGIPGRHRLDQRAPVGGEGGDQVDVPVGVAILDQALTEPDQTRGAEVLGQQLLDRVLVRVSGCGSGRAGTARS